MGTKIRFRSDGWHFADLKSYGWTLEMYVALYSDPKEKAEAEAAFESVPEALPGDIWEVHWYKQDGEGPLAGYAICCPACKHVHSWITASNCSQKVTKIYTDKDGKQVSYQSCVHQGIGTCWTWTGSAKDGTLSAHPSLLVLHECHWHGWLKNGELTGT